MSKDCKLHVRTCRVCSLNKKASVQAKAGLGRFHAGSPMERVHVDILGPLTPTACGNQYVLVVCDQFTKWVEFHALPNQKASLIAKTLVDEFFSRFGCPLQIHSDQGRNFEGNVMRALCELLEISKTRTTPYHPSSNGQVERNNRTLLQMVRCFLQNNQRNWDLYLQQLAGAMRASVSRQTGFSANMLMLGREVMQPMDLILRSPSLAQSSDPADYVKSLCESLQRVQEFTRENLRVAQERQKRDYDLRLHPHSYDVGDLVHLQNSASKKGQSNKLKSPWIGPYLVTKVVSPVLYRIRNRRRESVVHHDRIKPCEDRVIPLWMRRLRHRLFGPDPEFMVAVQSDGLEGGLDTLFAEDVPSGVPEAVSETGVPSVVLVSGSDVSPDAQVGEADAAVSSSLDVDVVSSAGADGSGVASSSPRVVSEVSVPSSVMGEVRPSRHKGLPHHLADYVLD